MNHLLALISCGNCASVCVCLCVCNAVRRGEGGCVACVESREIKDIYEMLGLPQRACDSHNHVQYYYRMGVFTKSQGLHQHFARHSR